MPTLQLCQALFMTCSVIRAQNLNDNDFEDEYKNPYVFSDFELGDYPEEAVEDLTPRSGGRRKQKVVIDMNWWHSDERQQMVFETLFPNVTMDPEFLQNEETIREQDEEICRLQYDPAFPDVKVRCDRTRSTPKPKIKYMTPARKFKQLKSLVLWLQQEKLFGRYCYYGCHCLPEGNHNLLGGGYGVPVDPIDRSCKNFFQCYECAKMENQMCQGDKVKYKYSLQHDLITNERWIECHNPVGTCGRNICECDKRWAETLAKHEDQFNSMFHKNRAENPSDWVYNNECRRTKGKFEKPEECCGTQYPDKMPLQKGKQCCGYRPFDPEARKCCSGDKIRETCDA